MQMSPPEYHRQFPLAHLISVVARGFDTYICVFYANT